MEIFVDKKSAAGAHHREILTAVAAASVISRATDTVDVPLGRWLGGEVMLRLSLTEAETIGKLAHEVVRPQAAPSGPRVKSVKEVILSVCVEQLTAHEITAKVSEERGETPEPTVRGVLSELTRDGKLRKLRGADDKMRYVVAAPAAGE